jgi:hypothetical protein
VVDFLVEPENQGGGGFVPQNHRDGFLIWASKSSVLQFVGCTIKPTEEGRRGTCIEI